MWTFVGYVALWNESRINMSWATLAEHGKAIRGYRDAYFPVLQKPREDGGPGTNTEFHESLL